MLFPGMIGNGNGNGVKRSGKILYFVVKKEASFISHFQSNLPLNCIVNVYKCDELRNTDLFKYVINKRNAGNNQKSITRTVFGDEYALTYV